MEDKKIIQLYWDRSESAIKETDLKYGGYCRAIAVRILYDASDAEECVNDTYLKVWNAIPPQRPSRFSAFLAKITRNLALNRYEYNVAAKRGGGAVDVALEELSLCIPTTERTEDIVDELTLREILNRFLASLPTTQRKIFMQRYWYFRSVRQISQEYGLSESRVKMSLMRSRNTLREILEKEGISL